MNKPLTYREVHGMLSLDGLSRGGSKNEARSAAMKKADRLLRLKRLVAARKWAEKKAMRQ